MQSDKNRSSETKFGGSPQNRSDITRLRAAGAVAAVGNGLTGVILPLTLALSFEAIGVALALTGLSIGMMLSFARGGAVADSGNRVRTMVQSDVLRSVMNIVVAVGILGTIPFGRSSVVAMVVATLGCFGNGLMAGYFRPAQSSMWASIVERDRLQRELQINSLLNRTGLALGAALGGMLIAFGMGVWGFFIDAASFLVTALLVARIAEPRPQDGTPAGLFARLAESVRKTMRIDREWKEIIRLTKRSTWMRFWFLCSLNASWAAAVSSVVAPVVLVTSYTSLEAGLFQSVRVFALLIGALVAFWLSRIVLAGALDAWYGVGSAVSYLSLGLGAPAFVPIALSGTSYVAQALSAPSIGAYVGRHFPDEERGRIYAAVQGVSSVLAPVGMLLGGVLMSFFEPGVILVVASSLAVIFCALPLVKKSYWTLSA